MPIRFRCVYCKQLMGISRRKAGTVVRCPKCAHEVMVPLEDGGPNPQPAPTSQEPLFERSDFDDLIQQAQATPGSVAPFDFVDPPAPPIATAAPPPAAPPEPAPVDVEQAVEINPSPTPPAGLLLSPVMATTLAVCVIIGLAVAFIVGLFVGYHLRPREDTSQSRARVTLQKPGAWVKSAD